MPPVAPVHETVASSGGVAVVVHHLASGPSDAPLLIAHATGFHGRAYSPVASAVAGTFDLWGLDARGHGVTAVPPGWQADWRGYGDDTTAAARWLADRTGAADGQLVGFGHSMGGATLLMAAHRHPGLFRALVLFEPIVSAPIEAEYAPVESPLVQGARRRRRVFPSLSEAIDRYASKPPMDAFDRAALEEYVYGGFRPIDATDPNGPVELTCDPELEAATFATGHDSGLWPVLGSITTPTMVMGGRPDVANPPALLAEPIAGELPRGRYLAVPELDHFGPFVDPRRIAELILQFGG